MAKFILISGKQGSGKTTTSVALEKALRASGFGAMRHRFATALYLAHDAVYAVLRPFGILKDTKKDGLLLQVLGTEWGRATDPDLWVKHVRAHAAQMDHHFKDTPAVKVVIIIEDTRFENELNAFPAEDCIKVRLECPEEIRKPRTDQWRGNANHPSETELDNAVTEGRFELVFHTDKQPIDEVIGTILGRAKGKWGGT